MKLDDIVVLANAGFTKEDIAALIAAENPATPTPAPATPAAANDPAKPEENPAEPKPAENPLPANDPTPAPDIANLINAGFAELAKKLMPNGVNPSMGDPTPVGVEDVISKMMKEI